MTFQEYFRNAEFEEVWVVLNGFYLEDVATRPLYERVFGEIRGMSADADHSEANIKIIVDSDCELKVCGTPDPIEWLIGREVELDFTSHIEEAPLPDASGPIWLQTNDALTKGQKLTLAKQSDASDIAAHLLYWSTLYGIKTQKMQSEGFSNWLKHMSGGPYYTLPDNDFNKIDESVMLKYVFLDLDGVLNTEQYQAELAVNGKSGKDKFGALFDPKSVARLEEILSVTKAELVLVSSWRQVLSLEEICDMWENRGLPGHIHYLREKEFKSSDKKGIVESFLNDHTFIPYIILDDESEEYTEEMSKALIQVNPVAGISKKNVEEAIKELNKWDDKPCSFFKDARDDEERASLAEINDKSCQKKKQRYWASTIAADEAYDWNWNFTILRKKLEYNIGYYRFTQRYEGWEHDVARMALAYRLMKIAQGHDSIYDKNHYLNTRNCSRFKGKAEDFEAKSEFLYLHKDDLRKEKAYQLVWKLLSQDMKKWWD